MTRYAESPEMPAKCTVMLEGAVANILRAPPACPQLRSAGAQRVSIEPGSMITRWRWFPAGPPLFRWSVRQAQKGTDLSDRTDLIWPLHCLCAEMVFGYSEAAENYPDGDCPIVLVVQRLDPMRCRGSNIDAGQQTVE